MEMKGGKEDGFWQAASLTTLTTSTAPSPHAATDPRSPDGGISGSIHLTRICHHSHLASLPPDFLSNDTQKPLLHIDTESSGQPYYKYYLQPMQVRVPRKTRGGYITCDFRARILNFWVSARSVLHFAGRDARKVSGYTFLLWKMRIEFHLTCSKGFHSTVSTIRLRHT